MTLSLVLSGKKLHNYQPIMCECPCCGELVAQDIVPKEEYISILNHHVEMISEHYRCTATKLLWQSPQMVEDERLERVEAERNIAAYKRVLGIGART